MAAQDLTIRELQTNLPWSIRYSADFRATPMSHKDFAHGLTHIVKASGMLAALVDDMDHRKETADDPTLRETYGKYLADFVVCALRMANTFPGGALDLQRAVEDRLESKNGIKLPRSSPHASQMADALETFWNAALNATHGAQDGTANAVMHGMVEGVAAVAARLRQGAVQQPPSVEP